MTRNELQSAHLHFVCKSLWINLLVGTARFPRLAGKLHDTFFAQAVSTTNSLDTYRCVISNTKMLAVTTATEGDEFRIVRAEKPIRLKVGDHVHVNGRHHQLQTSLSHLGIGWHVIM